jgi:ribokinase
MIVVFGSINADLVATVAELPCEGETRTASSYAVHAGGKGANQALAARRAGASVALFGAVGRDGFADVALGTLRDGGVDLSGVAITHRPTGVALIHVDAQGRNTITIVPGANAEADSATVADAALGAATTLLLQLEVPAAEVIALAGRAHDRGSRVILNLAPPLPVPDALLDAVDVLVANEHEAEFVARECGLPSDPVDFCAAAADRWRLAAIVTLGAEGLVAADRAHRYRVAAAPVDVRDTTAAGDAFVGALAAALDRNAALREALAEGAAAGSHACAREGAQPSIGARGDWRDAAHRLAAEALVDGR